MKENYSIKYILCQDGGGEIKHTLSEIVLILSFHPKLGAKTILKLAEKNLLSDIFNIPTTKLKELDLSDTLINYLKEAQQYDLKELKAKLAKSNIQYITFNDSGYPTMLSEIPDKPAILFYKGNLDLLGKRLVAVVGSRKFTNYAKQATLDLVGVLAKTDVGVVSGLALGIDSIAHQACLDNQGSTIAVLGNGLDSIYPASHLGLARNILNSNGLIISEFPPGSEVYPGNFPMRNRIIAGLCEAVIIVEAGLKSGSLITAKLGLDYNREVMVVPHNWYIDNGRGGNLLIKEGATLINSPQDILENLSLNNVVERAKPKLASPHQQLIYAQFKGNPMHVDELIKKTGLPASLVGATLTLMEINGSLKYDGGNIYSQMI